jgi:hypothetical protein
LSAAVSPPKLRPSLALEIACAQTTVAETRYSALDLGAWRTTIDNAIRRLDLGRPEHRKHAEYSFIGHRRDVVEPSVGRRERVV